MIHVHRPSEADAEEAVLHLRSRGFSYLIGVNHGFPLTYYCGPPLPERIPNPDERALLFSGRPAPGATETSTIEPADTGSSPETARGNRSNSTGDDLSTSSDSAAPCSEGPRERGETPLSHLTLRHEYPGFLAGDTRPGAYRLRFADGTSACTPRFADLATGSGALHAPGLPSLRNGAASALGAASAPAASAPGAASVPGASDVTGAASSGEAAPVVAEPVPAPDTAGAGGPPVTAEAEWARIRLTDERRAITIDLYYVLFPEVDALVRFTQIHNAGTEPAELLEAASLAVDLPEGEYEVLHLAGAWGRERIPYRHSLPHGAFAAESVAGRSDHAHSPFLAICDPAATEATGRVWQYALVYSGNHRMRVSRSPMGAVRVTAGIHPDGFRFLLRPGDTFTTPQALFTFSEHGFEGASHAMHRAVRRHLIPPQWRARGRPVVLNTWEAFYFDVDEDRVRDVAPHAAQLGAEVVVIDDGWFGARNDDTSSLGDWHVNPQKFPNGLAPCAAALEEHGLTLGIWMEPEMISPRSKLYDEHPEWVLAVPGQPMTLGRHQLVLDLSRQDVQNWIIETVSRVLRESNAGYLKWDMNRPFSELGSRALPPEQQGEVAHRYVLGLYRVLEELTRRHPDVLIEGCSAGGARFDLGMLAYVPLFWTSDDTDAAERIRIQQGTSYPFPPETISSHISAVPNHQVGRVTPPHTRAAVALFGSFGLELDPRALEETERSVFIDAIARAKRVRAWLPDASFYRLTSAHSESHAAWALVSADRSQALVLLMTLRAQPNPEQRYACIRGLDPTADYRDVTTGAVRHAAFLAGHGLPYPINQGDWATSLYELERV